LRGRCRPAQQHERQDGSGGDAACVTRLRGAAGPSVSSPAAQLRAHVNDLSLHLAPIAPALWLILVSLGLLALSMWAYRFAIPPLPELARRSLPAVRALALVALAWLLAQPVLERARAGRGARLVVLLDKSRSMD